MHILLRGIVGGNNNRYFEWPLLADNGLYLPIYRKHNMPNGLVLYQEVRGGQEAGDFLVSGG